MVATSQLEAHGLDEWRILQLTEPVVLDWCGASRCGDGACSIENSGRIGTSSRACTRVSNASWGAGTLCTGSGYGEDASPECGHADRVLRPWSETVVLACLIDGILVEFETDRVDAVAQIGRCRVPLTFEDMAKVSTTGRAAHFSSDLSKGSVLQQDDGVRVLWRVEAGPSAVRIKLRRGAEQLHAAGTTPVGSGARGVGVLANEGWFGACLAQHVVRLGAENVSPLGVTLGHGVLGAIRTKAAVFCRGCGCHA